MIEAVIKMDLTGTNAGVLAERIEEAKRKRTGLIDLYTSGDIDRSEFNALRAKYDEEIERLKSMAEGTPKQQTMIQKQQELMKDIRAATLELISGIQYEDEYYTQILDKMVVGDKDHIDVYLKMLPHKWAFAVEKSVKGAMEASATNLPPADLLHAGRKKAEASECATSEASLPISLSTPMATRFGMVKRWER